MFRLADPDHRWRGVVEVRRPDGEVAQFGVEWRLVADSRTTALLTPDSAAPTLGAAQTRLLREVLVGWEDVRDHDDAELPFSAEALERLCDERWIRRAVVDAYLRFAAGLPEKNSLTPPASGAAAATEH